MPTSDNMEDVVSYVFCMISPDQVHDQHFVVSVQREIKTYLTKIGCDVETAGVQRSIRAATVW